MHRTLPKVQKEREAPALGDVVGLWVQFRQYIRVLRFWRHDGLPGKIREFGDLVREHGFDGLLLEQSGVCGGVETVVQKHGNDLSVLAGLGEAACAALLEYRISFGLGRGNKRGTVDVAVEGELEISCVEVARVHVREFGLHALGREHGDLCDADGCEDVLLKVIVQGNSSHTFNTDACPVDVDTVLPTFAWLVDERLG